MNMKFLFLVFTLMLVFASVAHAQLVWQHLACGSGGKLCTATESCRLSLTEFTCSDPALTNCNSCPDTTITLAGGTVASCHNTCEAGPFGITAGCTACVPTAEDVVIPTKILPFTVFQRAPVSILASPQEQTALAGQTLNYRVAIRNSNPFQIIFTPDVTHHSSLTSSAPETVIVAAGSEATFTFSVTSAVNAVKGPYDVFVELRSGEAQSNTDKVTYKIADILSPSISVSPLAQQGAPGEAVSYQVTLTNNAFREIIFSFSAQLPSGWSSVFTPSTLDLQPAGTGTTTLRVTSSSSAVGGLPENIRISASSSLTSAQTSVTYHVVSCGDSVCSTESGETTGSCPTDCPATAFVCNGECDTTTESGVNFLAVLNNFAPTKFIVCSRNSTEAGCEADFTSNNCGMNKKCLCGSVIQNRCSLTCYDTDGIYYLFAKNINGDTVTSAKFQYSCPDIGMTEVLVLKQDFENVLDSYEISQSAFNETIESGRAGADRATMQACHDALYSMIQIVSDYLDRLDAVIAAPSVSAAQEVTAAVDSVRSQLAQINAQHCRGFNVA